MSIHANMLTAHLQRDQELLLGEALLDGAVDLPHQALARPHVQHQVHVAHVYALRGMRIKEGQGLYNDLEQSGAD